MTIFLLIIGALSLLGVIRINQKVNTIMAQIDDLNSDLASLKTELDSAKDRDASIQATLVDVQRQLAALQANPPADLTAALQSVKDDIAEVQTIGAAPAAPTA